MLSFFSATFWTKPGQLFVPITFPMSGVFAEQMTEKERFFQMIAVWCVHEWQKCGSPEKLQVVELGPGRGTLADDMLRVSAVLQQVLSECVFPVSPKLTSRVTLMSLCFAGIFPV